MSSVAHRHIVFIINPISGGGLNSALQPQLKHWAQQKKLSIYIHETTRVCNAETITALANNQHASELVACGGDGTVNMVAHAAVKTNLPLSIISSGSGNGLARAAAVHLQLQQALDVIANGKTTAIDTFTVNGNFACMMSGLGFDAAVAKRFAGSTTRGMRTYIRETLLEMMIAKPYAFGIDAKGLSFTTNAFFISVANSNQYGNNVRIAPDANISDGLLDVVVVQEMSKLRVPFAVAKHMFGKSHLGRVIEQTKNKQVIYFQTPELTVHNKANAPLHIDGDTATTAASVNFCVNKASLLLKIPNL